MMQKIKQWLGISSNPQQPDEYQEVAKKLRDGGAQVSIGLSWLGLMGYWYGLIYFNNNKWVKTPKYNSEREAKDGLVELYKSEQFREFMIASE